MPIRRVATGVSEIREIDHTTTVVVAPGSFVIVFPGGHKKSWGTFPWKHLSFRLLICLVLNRRRAVLPLIQEQCDIRGISFGTAKYLDFEGKSLIIGPETTMAEINFFHLYVV